MPPSPFLLWVNSRLTQADNDLWTKWHIEEHIPDLIEHKVSTRASFYKEVVFAAAGKLEPHPRKVFALYQTDFEEPLKSEEYLRVRTTSELLPGKQVQTNGEFNMRNYKLIQDYDPERIGEEPARFILTAEMNPEDEVDFHKWYNEEHLHMIHRVPGHRRSQRYVIGPKVPELGDLTKAPNFLAIHEFDTLDAYKTNAKEVVEIMSTPWNQKHFRESTINVFRMFELVKTMGFK